MWRPEGKLNMMCFNGCFSLPVLRFSQLPGGAITEGHAIRPTVWGPNFAVGLRFEVMFLVALCGSFHLVLGILAVNFGVCHDLASFQVGINTQQVLLKVMIWYLGPRVFNEDNVFESKIEGTKTHTQ